MNSPIYDPMNWDNPAPPRKYEADRTSRPWPADPEAPPYAFSQLISALILVIILVMLLKDTITIRSMPAFDTSVISVPPPMWTAVWNRALIGRIGTEDGLILRLRPGLAGRIHIGQKLTHAAGSPFLGVGNNSYLLYHPFLLGGLVLSTIVVCCYWLEIDSIRRIIDGIFSVDPSDPMNILVRLGILAFTFFLWMVL